MRAMSENARRRGAAWIRVSTAKQDELSQVPDIEQFAAHHNIDLVKRYELNDMSAYKGEQEAKLREMLADAWAGQFEVLVIWAADRIERRGVERLLRLIRKLREAGAVMMSVKDPWISGGTDPMDDLGVAMAATQARMESERKSERIRMGMAKRRRRLEAGKEVKGRQAMGGRVKGSRNRQPRPKLTGEAAGWTDERRQALAERNKATEWTPQRREARARASHQRSCPIPDCQQTSAHAYDYCLACGYKPGSEGHLAQCGDTPPRGLYETGQGPKPGTIKYLAFWCPTCGALEGYPCVITRGPRAGEVTNVHDTRKQPREGTSQ